MLRPLPRLSQSISRPLSLFIAVFPLLCECPLLGAAFLWWLIVSRHRTAIRIVNMQHVLLWSSVLVDVYVTLSNPRPQCFAFLIVLYTPPSFPLYLAYFTLPDSIDTVTLYFPYTHSTHNFYRIRILPSSLCSLLQRRTYTSLYSL